MGPTHRPAAEIATDLLALVEQGWAEREAAGIAVDDLNDVYLLLGYTRAFRCFETIRDLAVDGRNDDALVLVRSLISIVLRSLYVIASDQPEEHELRRRRVAHEELQLEEKRLRLGGAAPGEARRLPEVRELLQESGRWFDGHEASSTIPNESDVADALGLSSLYRIVYRVASQTAHHSLHAPVPLRKPTPELTESVLLWAIASYAELLERAEPTVQLGLAEPVRELVAPWLEPRETQGK